MARIIHIIRKNGKNHGKHRDTRAITPEKHAAFLVRQAYREMIRLAYKRE